MTQDSPAGNDDNLHNTQSHDYCLKEKIFKKKEEKYTTALDGFHGIMGFINSFANIPGLEFKDGWKRNGRQVIAAVSNCLTAAVCVYSAVHLFPSEEFFLLSGMLSFNTVLIQTTSKTIFSTESYQEPDVFSSFCANLVNVSLPRHIVWVLVPEFRTGILYRYILSLCCCLCVHDMTRVKFCASQKVCERAQVSQHKFSRYMNEAYAVISTGQVLMSFLVVASALVGYMAFNFVNCVGGGMVFYTEMLMYCYIGQILDNTNNRVATVISSARWFTCRVKYQKDTLVALYLAQKMRPIYLVNVCSLNFSTGLQLTKNMYSLIMFMMEMFD